MYDLQRRLTVALGDRYTVLGRLGSGTTAIVFLVRDTKHDREVALKVLRPEFAQTLGTERFLREIRLVAGFTHPHILPLHDSGEVDNLLYYSMPLARGGSLRTRLARERQLPVADAVRIAYQVANALAYAHTRGVIHRDIKPENILLEEGQVLLTDFGLARAGEVPLSPLTDPGLAVGTPVYMSPEQAAGMTVDGRSDVYALGCVLFEMLDGEAPFTGRSAEVVLARHRSERPRSLDLSRPGLPPALKVTVSRALAKVPADRYVSATEFGEAIRMATDGTSSTSGGAAIEPRPRRRWREVAAAVVMIAIPAAIVARGAAHERPAAIQRTALDPRAIAVLYFSGTEKAELIATGIREELIDQLSSVPVLKVVSADGMRQYQGKTMTPDSVAKRFGAGSIVAGTVVVDRDSVRVTVRMIDGNDGHQFGAFVVTEPRVKVSTISSVIAGAVGDQLRHKIGEQIIMAEQRDAAHDPLAWEFTKEAQQLSADAIGLVALGELDRSTEVMGRADSLIARVIARDPSWSDPWVERGAQRMILVLGAQRNRPFSRDRVVQLCAEAIGFANHALLVAKDSTAALDLRGYARAMMWRANANDLDLEESERDLLRATAMKPAAARAWRHLGEMYFISGRYAEASVASRHALAADAYMSEAPALYGQLLWTSLETERFDEARRWCADGRRKYPSEPRFVECGLSVLARDGRGPAAVAAAWQQLKAVDAADSLGMFAETRSIRYLWVATVLARSGMADSARAVIKRTAASVPESRRPRLALYEAMVYCELNQPDLAIDALRRFMEIQPSQRQYIATTPTFRILRNDERFIALVNGRKS